jgi:hypothetical protein
MARAKRILVSIIGRRGTGCNPNYLLEGKYPHPLTPSRKGRGNTHALIFMDFQ